MKAYLLFFIALLTIGPAIAQTSDLDKLPLPVLKEKLALSKNDTTKVQIQLALGHLILFKSGGGDKEIDSSLAFALQAGSLSRQLKYNFGIINALLLSAESYLKKKDTDKGLKFAQQALDYAKKVNSDDGMGRAYYVMGFAYTVDNPISLRKRMDYNDKAIAHFRKGPTTAWIAHVLTTNAELLFLAGQKTEAIKLLFEILNLGNAVSPRTVEGIYWLIGRTSAETSDYPNALKYTILALKTAKQVNDTTLQLCSINHTMTVTYVKMQDYQRALPYSLVALKIARKYDNRDYINTVALVQAVIYSRINKLNKALALLEEAQKYATTDLQRLTVTITFLNVLTYAKQFEKAERYAQEVRRTVTGLPAHNFNEILSAYNFLSNHYFETKQFQLATHYTALHAKHAREGNFPAAVRTAETLHFKLDSIKGDFRSAVQHYLAAQKVKDSVDNVTKAYQISLLQIENETEQKNSDIEALTKQAQIKDEKIKRNQLIQNSIITVSILLLIITALIYSRYRLKQKNNRKLEINQRELDQKNMFLETLNTDQQKLLKEKEWLIKEVHHRVKNNLQMVTSLLYSQSAYLKDAAAVLAIKDSLRRMQAMSLIHQKLYQDENTSTLSMPEYINDLVQYLHESFDADNRIVFKQQVQAIDLDVSQAIPLGLILTESVVNAIKYAFLKGQQGMVYINLSQDGSDGLLLEIADNGIGLPEGFEASDHNSLGLDLMQGLAKQLKGSFDIQNDNGVRITVRFVIFKP